MFGHEKNTGSESVFTRLVTRCESDQELISSIKVLEIQSKGKCQFVLIYPILFCQETGIHTIRKREQMLMWRFYDQVKKIPGVTVYGDFSSSKLCAFVVSSSCVYRDALKLKFCVPDISRER